MHGTMGGYYEIRLTCQAASSSACSACLRTLLPPSFADAG